MSAARLGMRLSSGLWYRRIAPAVCCLAAACGSGDHSAGGRSIEDWSVGAAPLVSIGGADDRPDYLVYGAVAATRLSDGRLAVAAQGSSEVKYFTSAGVHFRTVGGEGDGPGEFRAILAATRLPGDTLLVLSRDPGLTWLSPQGDFVRSLRVSVWSPGRHACRIAVGRWQGVPDGRWITVFEDNPGQPGCDAAVAGLQRHSGLIELQDFERDRFDTIAILPAAERNSADWRVYGRELVLAAALDRVYAADSGSDRILVLGLGGDSLGAFPVPFQPEAVPEKAKQTRTRPPVRLPPGVRPPIPLDPPYAYPEFYPGLGRMLVDLRGALWVMAYPAAQEPVASWHFFATDRFQVEEGGARWRVLDEQGRVLANVRTPPGVFPLEIGEDYVLGLSKDEYDVEAVQLYSLKR